MEFIANLEQSQNATGLTEEKLKYLEQVFQNAVGDKEEIDLDRFKSIVQSKNMFFVERIFHVFDADGSGTVSLEEFMRVMRCFAQQSPAEKLRCLFNVYDLNNDGTIQFNELRNVISECMKENGLKFQESEIDELTKMLFEDADTDGSGSINFEEFKNQLERHPAFLQNLTLSLERWLLPPMTAPKRSKVLDACCKRTLTWQRIRNNWTHVTFLFLYFFINLILFASRAYEYRESNVYVILARACGQCLNFNSSFILLLILRQTLTWLRTHGYSQYFPIDHHLYYHKVTGWVILFYSILHTVMHIINFCILSKEKNIPLHELLVSTRLGIGWVGGSACLTGWLLLALLVIMVISAMPFVRRSGKFEVFYCLHLLSIVFWGLLVLHGPNFWKWFLGPAILFLVEIAIRVNRNLSSSKKAYVQQGVLLPSKVTHLVIKRPPKFDYRPGDYVYINIPEIAKFEWHPFTISSAPELDDVLWLHIRGVGEWTNSLYSYFERADKEAVLSDDLAKDLEMLPSIKSDDDNFSMAVNCSSIRPTTPSVMGDSDMALTPYSGSAFNDSTLQFSSPNRQNETVIEVAAYPVYKNAFMNATFVKDGSTASSDTAIDMGKEKKLSVTSKESAGSSLSSRSFSLYLPHRRTSFSSTSGSRAIQAKNKEDIQIMLEANRNSLRVEDINGGRRIPYRKSAKEKRRSVRVSVAKRGLRRCQTVIVMPTVADDEDDNDAKPNLRDTILKTEEEMKDLKREVEVENVVVTQKPLKIFLDGPYGSPTRHIFHARHAVLIATGIGVTPFASILQSIMYQYRKSRHTCPSCSHKWSDPLPVSSIHLKKVDFFWLNRHQRAFEWFVNLLSELEIEQAQLEEQDRFLDIHMYITSALNSSDMKAVGLQMALDLLYQKEKRCLITGLKSRTQPGRPDWNKVFTSIAQQRKGKVTVFFCGPNQLAKTLQLKCDEFGFRFRKEIF